MTHPNHHPVTVVDVAREAGVSKSTASRVLAGYGSTSSRAHRKVTDAASKLGYMPNALAKAMVSGSSHTIGVIIPDVASPFFSAVVRGMSDAARAAGFEVIISNTDNDADIEARSLEVLAEKRVDGFIVAPVFQDHSAVLSALDARGVPLILLDRRGPGIENTPMVSIDHVSASEIAIGHLLDLGHRRIAIVTEAGKNIDRLTGWEGDQGSLRPSSQRLLGYVRALAAHGIEADPGLIIHAEYNTDDAMNAVVKQLPGLDGVTALYGTDSVLTSGAYQAMLALKIEYPRELSFVGFDDQEWTTMVRPAVTIVSQPRYRLGATTATCLIERIRHPGTTVQDIRMPARLIVRESTTAID